MGNTLFDQKTSSPRKRSNPMQPKKKTDSEDSEMSLRDEMRRKMKVDYPEAGKRDISVMTRLSSTIVEILDNLVKLGIFKSRSDAVAAIVEKTLLPQIDSFNKLKGHVEKLGEIQEEAMDIAVKALDGE
jgi:Arc/MetJ-type ribon-helix-helix transcriptional regulator